MTEIYFLAVLEAGSRGQGVGKLASREASSWVVKLIFLCVFPWSFLCALCVQLSFLFTGDLNAKQELHLLCPKFPLLIRASVTSDEGPPQ